MSFTAQTRFTKPKEKKRREDKALGEQRAQWEGGGGFVQIGGLIDFDYRIKSWNRLEFEKPSPILKGIIETCYSTFQLLKSVICSL